MANAVMTGGQFNYTVEQPKKNHVREAELRKPIHKIVDNSLSPSGINEEENRIIGLFGIIDPEKEYREYYQGL